MNYMCILILTKPFEILVYLHDICACEHAVPQNDIGSALIACIRLRHVAK